MMFSPLNQFISRFCCDHLVPKLIRKARKNSDHQTSSDAFGENRTKTDANRVIRQDLSGEKDFFETSCVSQTPFECCQAFLFRNELFPGEQRCILDDSIIFLSIEH
mmetsp:Transcript_29326/g.79397  ORF Transcript_29326/g.79397 Transcript_29326/m.79397 type:complete len:106 (-) Transcript_29326:386-703(-)